MEIGDYNNNSETSALALVLRLVHSHWSRNVEARLSLVERIIVMLRQLSYAIKNHRGASKIPLVGGILCSKAPSRGLWMPELVLYGIRELA